MTRAYCIERCTSEVGRSESEKILVPSPDVDSNIDLLNKTSPGTSRYCSLVNPLMQGSRLGR